MKTFPSSLLSLSSLSSFIFMIQNSVIRQLQVVFTLSTLLLLLSLAASFYSIRKLIENAQPEQQPFYVTYTPFLLVAAALISIIIMTFSFVRIRRETTERLTLQNEAEEKRQETARRIRHLEDITRRIAAGDYSVRSDDDQNDDLGRAFGSLNQMTESLEQNFSDLKTSSWLQQGSVVVSQSLRGDKDLNRMANRLLVSIAEHLDAPLATIYLADDTDGFRLAGSYAVRQAPATLQPGEGLTGQAIASQKTLIVDNLPADYHRVSSSLGDTPPVAVMVAPLFYDGRPLGMIEVGLLRRPTESEVRFMDENREPIAIGLNSALDYARLQNYLKQTQSQAEELLVQHTEMEKMNAELEMQTQQLQSSEEELRVQQEELQQTNAELEQKNDEIRRKADELEQATRYKSEFLANMSHELRTPLNSILLLSRLLSENAGQTLSPDQVEYARVIQSSGNGLLQLIDEILDLSKIEAGQLKFDAQATSVREVADELQGLFGLVASEKGLSFAIHVDPGVPATIETDKLRLGQILKNLTANAIKFTETGSVEVTIRPDRLPGQLAFTVTDTGIGIPPEKQPLIFEAFQQADGSTRRKFGGTGLGLSISRELARLLGGEISLKSVVGEGSEFTLHLPVAAPVPADPDRQPVSSPPTPARLEMPPVTPLQQRSPTANRRYLSPDIPEAIPDDRSDLTPDDKVILIVEDDTHFARELQDYARQRGYKTIVSVRGDEVLPLATHYRPLGILLDIQLPVMSGWEALDALKANPQTRPIPVHVMSAHKLKHESLLKGAVDFVDKPIAVEQMQEVFGKIDYVLSRRDRKVLIVEDNPRHARALAYFLETFAIQSELKTSVTEGIDALKRQEIDCVILDMGTPNAQVYETLEEVRNVPGLEHLPVIIFTGKGLSMNDELKIRKYADSIIVKTAHSYRRMLDEVSLFLHLVDDGKPAGSSGTGRKLNAVSQALKNKTVLVTDDDVRNIFALTKALEQYDVRVVAALDGKEALQRLDENPDVDVVLLDMMMPQLDGYETARRIREDSRWKNLPIIAVTAKAMIGDREKCIEAGASDYITKPVDVDQLISLLRVWLYERT